MGIKGMKFPRPAEINFPEIKEKNWKVSRASRRDSNGKRNAKYIWLLKSGNLLIVSNERDENLYQVKHYFSIYSVPDLKLVESYEFSKEIDEIIFLLDFAIQSKNGNIFMIADKLYIFDGENISKGPIKESEEINDKDLFNMDLKFYSPFDNEGINPINKKAKIFLCDYLFEAKEGIFLYTFESIYRSHEGIYLLDISKTKIEKNLFFHYTKMIDNRASEYNMDIMLQSEYFPENIYIIANIELPKQGGENCFESVLLCFNLEKFLNQKKLEKEPLFSIQVSKSQKICGMCEYDKKYILLDSYARGIYIIDVESKQKVAVSVPRLFDRDRNKFWNLYSDRKAGNCRVYRKIIKLKDGQIFVMGELMNIREQKTEEKMVMGLIGQFVVSGDYLISYGDFTDKESINIYEIKEEE